MPHELSSFVHWLLNHRKKKLVVCFVVDIFDENRVAITTVHPVLKAVLKIFPINLISKTERKKFLHINYHYFAFSAKCFSLTQCT